MKRDENAPGYYRAGQVNRVLNAADAAMSSADIRTALERSRALELVRSLAGLKIRAYRPQSGDVLLITTSEPVADFVIDEIGKALRTAVPADTKIMFVENSVSIRISRKNWRHRLAAWLLRESV
jgi:hypothetical protein